MREIFRYGLALVKYQGLIGNIKDSQNAEI